MAASVARVIFKGKPTCTALCTALFKSLVRKYGVELSKGVKFNWKLVAPGLKRQLRATASVLDSDIKILALFNGLLKQYVTVKPVKGGKRKIFKNFCLRRVLAEIAYFFKLDIDHESLDCQFCLDGNCRSDGKVTNEVATMLLDILSTPDTLATAGGMKRYSALPKKEGDATSGSASGSDGGGQGNAEPLRERTRFPVGMLKKAFNAQAQAFDAQAQNLKVVPRLSTKSTVSSVADSVSANDCDCNGGASGLVCQCNR
jgi:hypothetical protein